MFIWGTILIHFKQKGVSIGSKKIVDTLIANMKWILVYAFILGSIGRSTKANGKEHYFNPFVDVPSLLIF